MHTFDDFNSLKNNLEKRVANTSSSNPHFILMIGDSNAKSSNWSYNDTITAEDAQLDHLTLLYGMKQVITDPTHILDNPSSCIDLIFFNQPNRIMDSGGRLFCSPDRQTLQVSNKKDPIF